MTVSQISDIIISTASILITLIVAIYATNKIKIDKKAEQGNLMAKAEKKVAQGASSLVYQAQKDGGSGAKKFNEVMNGLMDMLDLAHLPHPTKEYMSGEIEKSVKLMNKTQDLIDTVNDKGDKNA